MSATTAKRETLEPTGSRALASMLASTSIASKSATSSGVSLISEVDADSQQTAAQPLISVVSTPAHAPSANVSTAPAVSALPSDFTAVDEDGPSLLEMMMQEQKQAAAKAKATAKPAPSGNSKTSGGFKKGFFGNSSSDKKTSNKASVSAASKESTPVITVNANKAKADKDANLVLDDVQSVMKQDNATLDKLRGQEWITPELTTVLQQNAILSAGLRDPRCLAAIELMQKDPKEAMRRFQHDESVSRFLQEFGKVMSTHFEALAQKQSSQQQQQQQQQERQIIQEVGPLQARAMQSTTNKKPVATSTTTTTTSTATAVVSEDEEQKKVQKILEDPELRALLMDADFQRLLMECSDPRKLQQHMSNADTARKIRKLQQAGLVQMQL